jgi:hypothetical protein
MYMCVYLYIYIYIFMHMCVYVYIYIYIYIHICVYVCVCVFIYNVCIHITHMAYVDAYPGMNICMTIHTAKYSKCVCTSPNLPKKQKKMCDYM